MKKKFLLMCVAGVLVMTAVIGGTLAGFNTSAQKQAVSDITVKSLGITMVGTGQNEATVEEISLDSIVPGGTAIVEKNIMNNVEGGYDVYTRVTIDKKWKDESLDPSLIKLYAGEEKKELVKGVQVNGWQVEYADEEQVIMYYSLPLKAGESTADFISALDFHYTMDNTYTGAEVDLSFKADAIQVIAAEDAMPSEWGIYPVIDTEGKITGIEE